MRHMYRYSPTLAALQAPRTSAAAAGTESLKSRGSRQPLACDASYCVAVQLEPCRSALLCCGRLSSLSEAQFARRRQLKVDLGRRTLLVRSIRPLVLLHIVMKFYYWLELYELYYKKIKFIKFVKSKMQKCNNCVHNYKYGYKGYRLQTFVN